MSPQNRVYVRWHILFTVLMASFTAVYTLLSTISPVEAATIIVNPGDSIQTAIDNATAGDTILISAGSYTESITLNKPVSLTGVSSATTILNAPLNQRVISVSAGIDTSVVISGMTIQNGGRGISPTHGGGIYLYGSARLSHLIVQKNHAMNGAGIYALTDISITSSIVQENMHGGGVYSNRDVKLDNTQILSNTTFGFGGGIFARHMVTASNSKISGNDALFDPTKVLTGGVGGGIFSFKGVHVINCIITKNSAERNSGAIGSGGYTILILSSTIAKNTSPEVGGILMEGSLIISDSHILDNESTEFGGALLSSHITVFSSTLSNNQGSVFGSLIGSGELTMTNSLVENNSQTSSQPISPRNSGLILFGRGLFSNTHFINNKSTGHILDYEPNRYYLDSSEFHVAAINSSFVGNTSVMGTGGIYAFNQNGLSLGIEITNTIFANNRSGVEIDHLLIMSDTVNLEHVTIVSSTQNFNTAVYLSGTAELTLTNSIVSSYTTAVETHSGSTANIDHTLFTSATPFSGTNITVGSNNLTDTNPHFADTLAGDYRLLSGSPAINAGTASLVSSDIDGNPRPGSASPFPDMGAYECDTATSPSNINGSWGNGQINFTWQGNGSYQIWSTPSPYQAIMGNGITTNMASYQHQANSGSYFYTIAGLSHCGLAESGTTEQIGYFNYSLKPGS